MKLDSSMLSAGQFSLGSDPEFFYLRDDDVAMNADKFLPGKDNKLVAPYNCTLFFDGFQGELNMPSSYCREGLVNLTRTCMRKARAEAGKKSRGKHKYRIAIQPVTEVLPEILEKAHEEARIFGCDPDFDAYASGSSNPPGPDAETHYMRYAGGHIHIGYGTEGRHTAPFMFKDKEKRELVRLIDVIAGVPMVLLDTHEGNRMRREMYGKAGCYRSPDYGVEWRVPSNFWLKSPELTSFMLGMVRVAANVMYSRKQKYFFDIIDQDAVRYAIDMNDFDVAKELYTILKPNLIAANKQMSDPFYPKKTSYSGHRYGVRGAISMPGPAIFEYLVYRGIGDYFKELDYEWSMGRPTAPERRSINGWYTGMMPRLIREDLKEFSEFAKGAIHGDVINF